MDRKIEENLEKEEESEPARRKDAAPSDVFSERGALPKANQRTEDECRGSSNIQEKGVGDNHGSTESRHGSGVEFKAGSTDSMDEDEVRNKKKGDE